MAFNEIFFFSMMSWAGDYIGGSLGAVGEELSRDTSCKAGRNWATKSEETPGPNGTGRDRGPTARQGIGMPFSPTYKAKVGSLGQLGCLPWLSWVLDPGV